MFINKYSTMKLASVAFIIAFLVFFIRFPQPVITPTIYAEDGVWIGSALSNGWIHTFLHARPDYFVFFNIFFLFISASLSKIFSGSVLMLLPLFIALVSYAFYAFTSVVLFLTIRRYSGSLLAFVAYFMSVIIPLGFSQAEVIGTLVQVGFYMPVLSICAHLYRDCSESRIKHILCDVLIFLMAATNPVNFAITGIYFCIKFFSSSEKKKLVFNLLPLLCALLALFLVIAPRMNGSGGIIGSYNGDNLIEMVTARSVLFPFIFPWYTKLGDISSVILTLLYVSMVVLSYLKADKKSRVAIMLLAAMLVIYDAATSLGRSGITGLLTGYEYTYPDRYFMGINIISIALLCVCVGQFRRKSIHICFAAIMLFIYVTGSKNAFESATDKRRIPLEYVYTNALCSAKDEGNGFSQIQILPSNGWFIRLPSGYIQSIECVRK